MAFFSKKKKKSYFSKNKLSSEDQKVNKETTVKIKTTENTIKTEKKMSEISQDLQDYAKSTFDTNVTEGNKGDMKKAFNLKKRSNRISTKKSIISRAIGTLVNTVDYEGSPDEIKKAKIVMRDTIEATGIKDKISAKVKSMNTEMKSLELQQAAIYLAMMK